MSVALLTSAVEVRQLEWRIGDPFDLLRTGRVVRAAWLTGDERHATSVATTETVVRLGLVVADPALRQTDALAAVGAEWVGRGLPQQNTSTHRPP